MSTRLSPYALALVFSLGSCAEFPKENVSEAPVQKAAQEMDFIRRQVVSAQQKSARLEVSLPQTNEQIKRLAVEVRKIQNNQNRLEENLNKLRREFLTWKETTRRPAPPRTPANLPRRPQRKAPAAPSSPRPAPVLRSKAPPPAAMKSPPTRLASLPPQEAYNRAYQILQEGKREEAILRLRDFLSQYANHRLAGNAQYWLGESFYDMKEYHSALDEFKKVITRYPKSHKVPDAYYKSGLTYLRLDNPRGAALEFEKLFDNFPSHPLTKKAREQVRSLKLPGNSLRK